MRTFLLTLSMLILGFAAQASDSQHSHVSKYAGQEKRAIKSLSPDDIAELKRGGGWGLAKAAELNGVPGPAHLLEMKDEIALDDAQVSAITEIYEQMKAQAWTQHGHLACPTRPGIFYPLSSPGGCKTARLSDKSWTYQ